MRYEEELDGLWPLEDEEGDAPEEILETTPEQLEEQRQDAKHTLLALYAGIAFFGLLFLAAGALLFKGGAAYAAGLLLGVAVAAAMAAHMYRTVGRAVEMEEKGAIGYTKRAAIVRMLLMSAALLAAVLLPRWFHLIGVMLGVLTLKGAALLYPVTNKILFHKGG